MPKNLEGSLLLLLVCMQVMVISKPQPTSRLKLVQPVPYWAVLSRKKLEFAAPMLLAVLDRKVDASFCLAAVDHTPVVDAPRPVSGQEVAEEQRGLCARVGQPAALPDLLTVNELGIIN